MTVYHKMKNRKQYIVGTIPKPNIKIVERGQIDTPNSQIYYLTSDFQYLVDLNISVCYIILYKCLFQLCDILFDQ